MTNTVGPVAHTSGVINVIGGFQQRVELLDGVHHRHRYAVVTAKPAAFALHAALLVAALMPRLAIPGFGTEVVAKRDPAVVFLPGAPEHTCLTALLRLS